MGILVLLGVICSIHAAYAVTHSWKAFITGSTGLSEFPEFVAVGYVDDVPVEYFDSRTNHLQHRQKWMEQSFGKDYMERQTNILKVTMQNVKSNVKVLMERFNQSGVTIPVYHLLPYLLFCSKPGPLTGASAPDSRTLTGYSTHRCVLLHTLSVQFELCARLFSEDEVLCSELHGVSHCQQSLVDLQGLHSKGPDVTPVGSVSSWAIVGGPPLPVHLQGSRAVAIDNTPHWLVLLSVRVKHSGHSLLPPTSYWRTGVL
ncbi:hypothetical protein AGOR_G00044020 [Albula goreensis]|uniref:MHC class I-like antigen recognition-like domain-containing protein n=1 Tax=Albula goreensis TaxID=1534307 RepID=A0A8T3E6W9_9TELE|nr:hypothetical protein AGOR_G00044020 [Albula goreensis]